MKFETKATTWLLSAICMSALLTIMSCDSDDEVNPGLITLQTDATLGDILVDGSGKTLYIFSKDVNGQSLCTGGCLTNWPVYHASNLQPGDGIDAADFATITRSDGTTQSTYKGWPLYYYSGDKVSGEVTGNGANNVWFAAKPNYSLMLASAQLVGNDGKNYTSAYAEGTGETEFLVDATGRTLYRFTKDYKDVNKFTKSDFSNNAAWPVFHTELEGLPSTLDRNDFGTITVAGNQQLTYKGNPLYYYGGDANRGETKGVSVPTPGVWPVVNTQTTTAPTQPTVMITAHTTFGNIMTDKDGRTLYFFARDTKGANTCTGGCATNWPIFYVPNVILPAGNILAAADFGTTGSGTSAQLTYKGRPLYYYAPGGAIEATGAVTGDNVGTNWFVAKPDYSIMIGSAQLVGNDGKNYTSTYSEGTGTTRYFTDAAGRTLYLFTNDKKNDNNFTAADLSNNAAWPMFNTTISRLPTNVNASHFGTITVSGQTQLTYKGWPLYYYGGDTAKGDTKGVSVPTPGKWPIVNESTVEAPL
jgi:predicted lipoprotein with Yx(FWY)xxD motif